MITVALGRMETVEYVNSAAREKEDTGRQTKNRCPGGSAILWLVGVSFGLLCIVQATLNVALRLNSAECDDDYFTNTTTNLTMTSADQIRDLILERNKLLLERVWLFQERREKEAAIINLVRDKSLLSDRNTELQNAIQELQSGVFPSEPRRSCCPGGWQPYMSSCYRSSFRKGTWDDAQRDCEGQRAHLVVLDDALEEAVVHKFAAGLGTWIGLRKQEDSSWRWTWVDGSSLIYTNWNSTYEGFWSFIFYNRHCALSPESFLSPAPWNQVDCDEQNYWTCEKELNTDSI